MLAEPPEDGYHLYVSPHNDGAAAVAELLRNEAASASSSCTRNSSLTPKSPRSPKKPPLQLKITHVPMERPKLARFLVYLNTHTHTRGEESTELHKELKEALDDGMPLLLVHEQRKGKGEQPFSFFLNDEVTPQLLLDRDIYKSIADPLYDDAHLAVSLRKLLACDGICAYANPLQRTALSHVTSRALESVAAFRSYIANRRKAVNPVLSQKVRPSQPPHVLEVDSLPGGGSSKDVQPKECNENNVELRLGETVKSARV